MNLTALASPANDDHDLEESPLAPLFSFLPIDLLFAFNRSAAAAAETAPQLVILLDNHPVPSESFSTESSATTVKPYALILLIIPLLTVFGNFLVMVAVYREKSLKTVTNYLICSLAVSDFLVALLVMTFAVYFEFNAFVWNLGPTLCNFYIGADVACSTASILNLLAISLDRYIAISHPLSYTQYAGNTRAFVSICIVWVISLGVGLPVFLGANRIEDTREHLCEFTNPYFIIISSLLSFFAPCGAMILLYAVIFRRLRQREKARSLRNLRRSRKATQAAANWRIDSDRISSALIAGDSTRVTRKLSGDPLSRSEHLLLDMSLQTSSYPTVSPTSSDEFTAQRPNGGLLSVSIAVANRRMKLRQLRRSNTVPLNGSRASLSLCCDNEVSLEKPTTAGASTTPEGTTKMDEFRVGEEKQRHNIKHWASFGENLSFIDSVPFIDSTSRVGSFEDPLKTAPTVVPRHSSYCCGVTELTLSSAVGNFSLSVLNLEKCMPIASIEPANTTKALLPDIHVSPATDRRLSSSNTPQRTVTPLRRPSSISPLLRMSMSSGNLVDSLRLPSRSFLSRNRCLHDPYPTPSSIMEGLENPNSSSSETIAMTTTNTFSVFKFCWRKHVSVAHRANHHNEKRSVQRAISSASIATPQPHKRAGIKHQLHNHHHRQGNNDQNNNAACKTTTARSKHNWHDSMRECRGQLWSRMTNSLRRSWLASGSENKKHMRSRPSRQLIKKASKQMKREQKATVTLAIVLAVFLGCWVPFFALHLSNAVCMLNERQDCVHFLAMFLTTWLGYLNSSLNPLIYTVFDQRFRKAFRNILYCTGDRGKQ